eukprot:TRINITY_DN29233_c1_g1_i1.p1 TRINITY_DN29233_c1_g1~~TRINITY_DN29233_c1_g1_i1.p1  ORF type:complete len:335 (-),score=23.44 TRINITY_DN29233_c1_g1_i1:157-1161(-)
MPCSPCFPPSPHLQAMLNASLAAATAVTSPTVAASAGLLVTVSYDFLFIPIPAATGGNATGGLNSTDAAFSNSSSSLSSSLPVANGTSSDPTQPSANLTTTGGNNNSSLLTSTIPSVVATPPATSVSASSLSAVAAKASAAAAASTSPIPPPVQPPSRWYVTGARARAAVSAASAISSTSSSSASTGTAAAAASASTAVTTAGVLSGLVQGVKQGVNAVTGGTSAYPSITPQCDTGVYVSSALIPLGKCKVKATNTCKIVKVNGANYAKLSYGAPTSSTANSYIVCQRRYKFEVPNFNGQVKQGPVTMRVCQAGTAKATTCGPVTMTTAVPYCG